MTTVSDQARDAVVLPLRPADGDFPGGRGAERAARTREADPKPAKRSRRPPSVAVAGVLAGADPLAKQPPAILTIWAQHAAAARFYEGWALRGPRFVYGGVHAYVVVPVLRFTEWALDSPPKGLSAAAVIVATLWLLHVI